MRPRVGEGRRRTGEDLDAPEGAPATLDAKARRLGRKIEGGLWRLVGLGWRMGVGVGLAKGEAAAGQEAGLRGMGEEPIVADSDKAFGEDVEEETAAELAERKGEGPVSSAAVVLVAEGDGLVIDGQEPMVREGNGVGVAGQVLEHVRMVDQGLAPGMEDGEEPETGAEMFRVVSDVLKRLGDRAKEEVVDDLRVLQGQGGQGLGQGEDHVGIRHR